MFKKTKVALMSLLCAGCVVSAGVGAVSVGVQASAAGNFCVDSGAAVRLKEEYSDFGIRFSATVGEVVEGAKYNLLILPAKLVEIYNNDTSDNKADIVTYMQKLAADNGGSLSIVEDCMVRQDGKIYGSIVNIKWNNLNRDFMAVAYYEKDGQITVAEMATENATRSIGSICKEALNSNEYTGTNKQILVDKLALANKQENGITEDKKDCVYYTENFDYATVGDQWISEDVTVDIANYTVLDNVADFQGNGALSIVDYNGSKALKYEKKVAAWNLVELCFSRDKIPAGTYKLSFELNELNDAYHKWILCGWDGDSYDAWYKTIQSDNSLVRKGNTYEYYFTYAEEGFARFGLCGQGVSSGWGTTGEIVLDNVSLTEVESVPTKAPVVFEGIDFEGQNSLTPLKDSGVYVRDNMTPALNYGENDLMTFTSKAYGAVYFYMGNVTKGSYILKMDASFSEGHPAVMVAAAGMTFDANNNVTSYGTDIYFNYKADVEPKTTTSFVSMASNNNGTRELLISIDKDYTNFAIGIANNKDDATYTMTIDNVSMEKVDYTKGYTVDFEGFGITNSSSSKGSNEVKGGTVFVNAGNYLYTNFIPTLVSNGTGTALQAKCTGWGGNFCVNLGYLEAGTYTITVDIAGAKASRGGFRVWSAMANTSQSFAYVADGTHTFTFTLSEGDQVLFGYKDAGNNQAAFNLLMDNLTVIKTA